MTSELRPAEEVATEICGCAYPDQRKRDIAVIKADREAVRAEQAAELAKFKALAETLAGAGAAIIKLIGPKDCRVYASDSEVITMSNALRQYKEATQ